MKKLDNQKGFGLWEILLLILLLILLGFIGWYVWQQSQKDDETSTPQSSVVITEQEESSEEANSVKYLEIPELGIKIPLNDATADAYYVMKDGYAYLSLLSLKDVDDCSAEDTGIVAISKVAKNEEDPMLGTTYGQYINDGGSGVIIGDDVYLMNRSQAYCSEVLSIQEQQQAAWNGFLTQAKSMVAL